MVDFDHRIDVLDSPSMKALLKRKGNAGPLTRRHALHGASMKVSARKRRNG